MKIKKMILVVLLGALSSGIFLLNSCTVGDGVGLTAKGKIDYTMAENCISGYDPADCDVTDPTMCCYFDDPNAPSDQCEDYSCDDIFNLFNDNQCASCHTDLSHVSEFSIPNFCRDDHWAKVSLSEPEKMLVVPGDPDNSYLIHKIEGNNIVVGLPMPETGNPMSGGDIQKVRTWITQLDSCSAIN
jgi:hypothetical protein